MGGQFGSGFGAPLVPGNGFMNQQSPYPFEQVQHLFGEPNYFGSGAFGRSRSGHSSRHRSSSRRRRHRSRSPSSSDDERRRRDLPFSGPEVPYQNVQPFQNNPPLFAPQPVSPVIPPQAPVW
jgi:hypothetical protein